MFPTSHLLVHTHTPHFSAQSKNSVFVFKNSLLVNLFQEHTALVQIQHCLFVAELHGPFSKLLCAISPYYVRYNKYPLQRAGQLSSSTLTTVIQSSRIFTRKSLGGTQVGATNGEYSVRIESACASS